VRVAREGGRNEPDLVLALNRAGSITDETHALTDEEIHRIAYDVTRGDPARGELVYRRKELGCVICHAIGGAGGKVGPDMTSLGASAVTDYIVESILVPNRKVKEGFHSIQVSTKDGQELSGILVRENTEQLVLRDVTNKEISVPKNNVESQRIGGSLMPSGLADALNPGERLDLFRFLAQLGKPGPFDATKGNVARVWKVRAGTSNVEQFGAEPILRSDLNSAPWVTVYSTVNGNLPRADLEAEMKTLEHRGVVSMYAASQLQLSREANVRLKVELPADAAIWIDGKPVSVRGEVGAQLSAGSHTITVKLDAKNLPSQIRVEASEGTFLVN
jgi:putative heme-binding domain-containing protein